VIAAGRGNSLASS